MSTPVSHRHVLMLVAATACWGCGTVLSKQALDRGVAPLTLLVIELSASSLLLSAALIVVGPRLTWSRSMTRLAALGLLNPGLAYTFGLLGLVTISASMSVLLWATEPVLILLFAALLLKERIRLATGAALAVALLGVLLVIYRPGAGGDVLGVIATVAAVTACAGYTVLTRWLILDDSSLSVVLVQQLVALCFALVIAGIAAAAGLARVGLPVNAGTWVLAAASGSVYYGLAFWFFNSGLRGVSASIGGSFLPLVPVFGLAAALVAGDSLTERQWLGAALVVAATVVAALRHLRR